MACVIGGRLLSSTKHIGQLSALNARCYVKTGPTELKGKSTAQRWMIRQMKDPFVKLARQEDYRCRSAFKLLEIDKRYDIIRPEHIVIDCGAAPGSWTQVALDKINERIIFSDMKKLKLKREQKQVQQTTNKGFVIAIDLLCISPIEGAHTFKCDFTKEESQASIKTFLGGRKADVIMSDMAPNATGIKTMDHHNSIEQVLSVLKFSLEVLGNGGTLLAKTFQGGRTGMLEENMKKIFKHVKWIKPHASRTDSAEIYILGQGFGQE